MIAIWGGGSAGNRYKSIINELGFETITLKRDANGDSFQLKNLNLQSIKGVVICTPTIFHSEQAIKLLEKNIPVLCEKPIAHSYEDGVSIVQTANRTGTKFHVGYNQRFWKAYNSFRNTKWGKPLESSSVWAERVSDWQPGKNFKISYSVRKDLGGGAPLTLSHDFDWWTGLHSNLEVSDVSSSKDESLGINIDTNFDIILDGDVRCYINLNYGTDGPPKRYYKTKYENGTLKYEPLLSKLNFYWKDGSVESILIEQDWNEIRLESFKNTFINFINDERKPSDLSEWEMGLSALKVATIVDDWND
tara:strand:+ start:3088 stop:4002 length:915 start_codon:yes stop_codon:yes gene_type:complete